MALDQLIILTQNHLEGSACCHAKIPEVSKIKRAIFLAVLVGSYGLLSLRSSPVLASGDPPKKEEPAIPAKKQEPPGLTGNKIPQCIAGEYPAGMICKKSPPGYYLDVGMKYPAPCPPGTTSPAGSRSISHCK
jgi:hypothetical protein